jgi:hypothetical protein
MICAQEYIYIQAVIANHLGCRSKVVKVDCIATSFLLHM